MDNFLEFIAALVCVLIIGFVTYTAGGIVGMNKGRDQVFNGSYACMKLPDSTTYCYKVETKNQ